MRESEILVKSRTGFPAAFLSHAVRLAPKSAKIKDNKMHGRITVRKLRLSDLDRVLEMERASFANDAYDRNLFAEFFHKCGELFLVAEDQRNVCGYIVTCIRGGGAELVSVAVDPPARGTGAASAMLESTLRRLGRRGVGRIRLMVRVTNAPARAFYEKYGFRNVRTVRKYYEHGEDGILMTKKLR
jgi:[ribosomal protein S18]-alanine N-acetyltransferase